LHSLDQTYFQLTFRDDKIVWLRRRGPHYETIVDIHRAYDEFLGAVDDWALDRRIKERMIGTSQQVRFGWLYDVREAPQQRNDDAFEKVIRDRRPDLLKRSPALCVLVRTAAGRMQITRMKQTSTAKFYVADDEQEAVEWLAAQIT
jgi:hypothetical protein